MATELAAIRRAVRNPASRGVTLSVTGVGRSRTRTSIPAVAESGPAAIIMVGFCGGAAPDLQVGDLHAAGCFKAPGTSASIVADSRLRSLGLSAARNCGTNIVSGPSATVDMLAGVAQKAELYQSVGAASVNMEDYWAADAARAAGIPFASVRAVLDTAGESLPDWIPDNGDGAARTVGRLVSHPRRVPGLLRVAGQAMVARRNLTRCVVALVDALASPQSSPSEALR